jgi:amino acid adenylation domain-containing protein
LIHELFESQVERTPGAVAVRYENQSLTYAELNRKANQLAHYLREQGVTAGQLIPILMPRSLQMLIGQLAVLKTGAAYVPIDPEFPLQRQAFMLRDCAARWALVAQEPGAALEPQRLHWIDCTAAGEEIGQAAEENLGVRLEAPAVAYVMYTSGSTGEPKGVMVPHHAVNRLVINNGYTQIEPSDCIAHGSNPAFDASTFEIWGALLNGARVAVIPHAVVLDAQSFAQTLQRQRVTVLWLTAGLFTQSVQSLSAVFGQLRYLLVGGDVVNPEAVREVLRGSPPRHLLNGYGPTEGTTFSATYEIETVNEDGGSIPIGRPIANTRIYILDARLNPVPIGVPGELYIAGAGVALGYLKRPELTEERFVRDPFSGDAQGRMYKTGDLGRWRADGNIEYLGRNDHQVKIRGFRIELGEIEAQLLGHEQIQEAVVIARAQPDVPGEKRLVAYVVAVKAAGTSEAVSVERLREYLKAVLPDYMVPSAFVLLESLPLTANGKLDRKALPAPAGESFGQRGYEAPQGEMESMLAQMWQELLQLERVGRHDNFFELGGHSLLAVESVHRLRHIGINVHLEQLFKSPTVASLTEWILSGSNDRLLNKSPVVLRDGAPRRPLFLVHEVTGHVFPFFLLAREIEADVPIYGLPLIEQPIPECIEQLASVHVTAIRNVQPRGPYRLAGHSLGGVLAYEIAAQLIDADETVEFLGLIDSYRPMPHADDVSAQFIDVELSVLRLYVEYLFPEMDDSQRQTLLAKDSSTHLLDYCKESGLLPRALNLMHVAEWARTYNILHTAVKKYVAIPLSVPTYLFVPDDDGNDRGWRAVLDDNLHIEKVGGTHISMIQQPHVRTLGQAMSRDLEVAESSRREARRIK